MKTGIIILNYNDAENTIKMIEQIKDYKNLSKIIIVDNCSKDDSLKKIKAFENNQIIVLEAKENLGYGSGNNIGLKYLERNTNCELVIISNPDIVVEESVMYELIKDMKQNEDLAFLGPKILEQGRIIRGWKLPTYLFELLSTINYFSRFGKEMQKYPNYYYNDGLNKVEAIHGSFFMARMSFFKRIHYFDPHTFLYYEENIIGNKCKRLGLPIMVDTRLSVVHNLSQSVNKSLKKIKKYKALKKSMFYYEKVYNHLNPVLYGFLKIVYGLSLVGTYLTFWI